MAERERNVPDPDDSERVIESSRDSTILRAAMAAHVAARASQTSFDDDPTARVLVADDDAATRELIASTLRESGYEVETVPDGASAVERVARGGLDIALLDAVMPRQSGVDACRTIKAVSRDDFVDVVLAFAKTDPKSRSEAQKIGADG